MKNVFGYALKIWHLLLQEEKRKAFIVFLFTVVGVFFEMMGVSVIIPVIGVISQPGFLEDYPIVFSYISSFTEPTHEMLVLLAMGALVITYFAKATFLGLLIWMQTSFSIKVQTNISMRLFSSYLKRPYTFHLEKNSAQLIRNVTTETALFTSLINHYMFLLTEYLVLLGIALFLIILNPLATLVAFFSLGLLGFLFFTVTKNRITFWGEIRQYNEGMKIQHLQQGLGGVKDVKVLGRESEFINQFQNHNLKSAKVSEYQQILQQLPRLWIEVIAVLGLVIVVGSIVLQQKNIQLILPTLGVFAAAAFRIMPSLNRILASMQNVRYGLPVIDLMHKELDVTEEEKYLTYESEKTFFTENIRIQNLSFSYPNSDQLALSDVSFSLKKGEMIGIIGESGSGKSTLVDIILGLLSPKEGEVYCDDVSIYRNLRHWQNQIGYVPQSIFLTDDSLIRNIAFGVSDEEIDLNAVNRAIDMAQLREFVNIQPRGLNTIMGERGVKLSGGQRQRIGIARALYHRPSILVLDEATSALDNETERNVMKAVTALHGQKTIIIIAHRLSTVENCDEIIRLSFGKLIQQGTPSSVLNESRN